MSAVSVTRIPEIFEEPEEQIQVTVGAQEPLLMSLQDARKLRDGLCVMVGMPRRKRTK